jgi:transaldolase
LKGTYNLIKIFLDSADINDIKKYNDSLISGLTTNPSLARKAGITDYNQFIESVLELCNNKPVSFEVLSNEPEEMVKQANVIADYGDNVCVKLPIKNTDGSFYLSSDCFTSHLSMHIDLNITAITTFYQVVEALNFLAQLEGGHHIISIFAGRIADCGYDPEELVQEAKQFILNENISNVQVLWASTREVFNIHQADRCGADIITCTPAILDKYISLRNMNLEDYAANTSKMFFDDAQKAGLKLCLNEQK